MKNESQPLATLHLTLDRPRELRVSFRAFARYATATGKDLLRDGTKALRTPDDFRTLVWSMARETDPTVTLEQLHAHITMSILMQVSAAIRAIRDGDGPARDHVEHPN